MSLANTTDSYGNGTLSVTGRPVVENYGYVSKIMIQSLVFSITMALSSGATVLMRVTSRWHRFKRLAVEDYFIIVAWIFGMLSSVLSHSKDTDGFGVATVSDIDLLEILHRLYFAQHFFYLALFLVQASVCLNYRTFSAGIIDRHSLVCDVLLVFIVIGSLAEILLYTFQCLPVHLFWSLIDRSELRCFSHTINAAAIVFGPPIFRCIIDIALMCIPIPLILRLRLPRIQKVAIIAVIGITCLSIFANIERLRKSTIDPPREGPSEYYSKVLPGLQLLSVLEVNTAIICANAVTLKAPLTDAWERFLYWQRGQRRPSLVTSISSISSISGHSSSSSFQDSEKPAICCISSPSTPDNAPS